MPRFDYQAAKASGYDDATISQYLNNRPGLYVDSRDMVASGPFGTSRPNPSMPAGMDERMHTPAFGASEAIHGSPTTTGAPGAVPASSDATASALRPTPAPQENNGQYPMLGMMGGGIMGGAMGGPPGAMIGASLGSGGGRMLQNALNGSPQDAPDIARHMLAGEVTEGAGQAGAGLLGMASKPLMHYALGTSPEDAALALRMRTGVGPGVVKGGEDSMLGGPEGVDAVSARANATGQKLDGLLARADAAGHTFSHLQIEPTLKALIKRGEMNPISNAARDDFESALATMRDKFGPQQIQVPNGMLSGDGTQLMMNVTTPTRPILPSELSQGIQEINNDIRAHYEQLAAQGVVKKSLPANLRAAKAVAGTMREMLRGIPGIGPQIADANGEYGNLLDLKSALTTARDVPPSLTNLMLTRGNASRAALGASNPAVQGIVQQAGAPLMGMYPNTPAPSKVSADSLVRQ